jgi:hypothetical protein
MEQPMINSRDVAAAAFFGHDAHQLLSGRAAECS